MRFLGRMLAASAAGFAMVLVTAPVALAVEGDCNNDGVVDDTDKQLILGAVGTAAGDPGFNAAADLDGDGVISGQDVSMFAKIYGAQN